MDEEIKKLLESNLKLTEEIHEMTKYIKKYVFLSKIFGVLKLLLIIVPLIIGIIYLPPLLQDVLKQYQDILGISPNLNLNGIDLNSISPELIERLR
ncbi:MAG: hypothetical protein ABIG60_00265 [Patescibacteria group bacterium]